MPELSGLRFEVHQRMTVWAKQFQIRDVVIATIAILVVQLKYLRELIPTATLASAVLV
jgi:hypothetical protein